MWADYHNVVPGEPHRPIHVLFSEHGGGISKTTFAPPFRFPLSHSGRRHVVVRLTDIGLINNCVNICTEFKNNFLFANGNKIVLNEACYGEIETLIFELKQKLSAKGNLLSIQSDHLGYLTIYSTATLEIPISDNKDGPIKDNLALKLGLPQDTNISYIGGYKCIKLTDTVTTVVAPDVWGSCAQLLVRCPLLANNAEMQQTLAIVPAASFTTHQHIHVENNGLAIPFNEIPELTCLELQFTNRYGEAVRFMSGVPYGTLQLMSL
ncbi:LO5 [Rhynchobatus djiddensis adomavirus 1]|uniref:LO5 n=1 Tax=Rhynchobatus djiddensis adomavirus 1 TaxID=2175117 RepID=A0A2S1MK20_9VIRU|nr:LO5 [Rhynchobatus djiddensis adomavirus 1]AWG87396.1 LO5 [Rhynchobatus djiddensis adomavirus 1]